MLPLPWKCDFTARAVFGSKKGTTRPLIADNFFLAVSSWLVESRCRADPKAHRRDCLVGIRKKCNCAFCSPFNRESHSPVDTQQVFPRLASFMPPWIACPLSALGLSLSAHFFTIRNLKSNGLAVCSTQYSTVCIQNVLQ